MPRPNDLSRSLVALHQDSTLIAVIELSQSSWLVAGIVPGLERQPLKKLEPDQEALLRLLRRWQDEATKAGKAITRIAVAFEAGRDGFWLARWLRARGIEAHVIHPTSVAVSREHRRAKTDRLDTELLKRAGRRRSRQCLEPSAGCGASRATAAWRPFRPSRKRTPGALTASGSAWWASAPGS
jgi:transposase